ncbi:MAG: phasin family protein [Kiloniellaceae bacterium]
MPTKKTTAKTSAKTTTKTPVKKAAPAAVAAPAAMPAATPAEAMEPAEDAMAASKETIETVMQAGTQAATKGYEQAIAIAQEQVDKASETIFKRYDEAASLSKDNVDAYVRSTTVFAQGFETMGKELMGIAHSAIEANVATTKALFGARTLRELIDLHTEFSRSRFDSLVSESAKMTELSMALANDAMEPIQVSVNATVEKMMKPLAA